MKKISYVQPHDIRVLDICRDVELQSEQLYLYFAGLFPGESSDARLWEKTAREEKNHAYQFELAIKANKGMLHSVSLDIQLAENILEYVQSVLDQVKRTPPGAREALECAIKLEERLAEFHLHCIAGFTSESQKKMFESMMAADNHHLKALRDAYSSALQG